MEQSKACTSADFSFSPNLHGVWIYAFSSSLALDVASCLPFFDFAVIGIDTIQRFFPQPFLTFFRSHCSTVC